jgi:hypothetical protein
MLSASPSLLQIRVDWGSGRSRYSDAARSAIARANALVIGCRL